MAKARITIDVDVNKLEWIKNYCDINKISRNRFFDEAIDHYKNTLLVDKNDGVKK
ncbi:hypothetical protein [Thermoactinomyces sp. CICC 10522]|uniref:hypothetical protein n=1 Tax=Thermoactinomyces sp. CICC 10522 TaxID=2767427 RepID=UPI0018DCE9F0|nr:hypothetical protein [Thermoactinomyces sp. CICC 10522]MBH8605579.1 hypothetical protein [Thermoactinomyces sp. CICC 10522]